MATYYAWSPIKAGNKSAAFGEEVTPAKLGVEKEDFDAMVEAGSVRTSKPPDLAKANFSGSVVEFYQRQAREAALEAGAAADEAALAAHNTVLEVQ